MSEDREYQTSNLHSQRLEDVIARQERQIKKQITQIRQLTKELQYMRVECERRGKAISEISRRDADEAVARLDEVRQLRTRIIVLESRCAEYQGILDRNLVRES